MVNERLARIAPMLNGVMVNLLGTLIATIACWGVLSLFDANPSRAEVITAIFGLVILAAGTYWWPYDRDFLDTAKIVIVLAAILAFVGILIFWDMAAHLRAPWSLEAIARFWRHGHGDWQRLLACMVFFFFVPFLLASAVRAAAIGVLVNGFGVRKFGIASNEDIKARNERQATPGFVFATSELGILVLAGLFWPGIWALFQMHDGRWAAGALAMVLWLAGLSLFCIWLHRRQLVSLWVSGSSLVAVVAAAIWVIWR
ncbi:MAG TPA: hypothetical protein VFV64_10430 [Permianibacter sp.]|nr:hypothetical protein [Permianibacter sp.]